MRRLELPQIEAVLEDVPGAIEITQRGNTYRARKWQLTDELVEVIQTAVQFGYSALWVDGHPSRPYLRGGPQFLKGSHHITFARSHGERWVFVVDGAANPPVPRDVTFNKGLRDFLERIGQAHAWEHSGGHNLRVPREQFREVLRQLDADTVEGLQRPSIRETYTGVRPITDIHNEAQLQIRIEEAWRPLATAATYLLDSLEPVDGYFPDIVVDAGAHGVIVVELKYSHAGGVEVNQLEKYLRLSTLRTRANGRSLRGALVARDFNLETVEQANSPATSIALYAFSQANGELRLHHVAGKDILAVAGLVQ